MRKVKTLTVNPVDAMVVFKADGTYESSLPEIAGDNVPEHLITAASILYALQDEEMVDLLHQHFHRQCLSLKRPHALVLFPNSKR